MVGKKPVAPRMSVKPSAQTKQMQRKGSNTQARVKKEEAKQTRRKNIGMLD